MKYIIALLLLITAVASNAQSDKIKKKANEWKWGILNAVTDKGSTETAELCKFYHEGEYKGKVYPAFIDQEPQDYFATVASKHGCMRCMCWLGIMKMHVYNGESNEANFMRALPFIQKAADGGDTKAMRVLASEYYMQYPWRDLSTSRMWYEKAAAKGDTAAQRQLAILNTSQSNPYEKGMEAYDKKNYEEAITLWKLDYNFNFNGKAAYNVGVLYANGRGVEKNYDSAHLYYAHACSNGFKDGCVQAGELAYAKGNYIVAAEDFQEAQRKGCELNQAHMDDAVMRKKATTDYWDKNRAEEKANEAARAARRQEEIDRKAAANYGIYQPGGSGHAGNAGGTGNTTPKAPAKRCPYCKGTGTIETAGSKSTEQDKNGRWYNTYTPRKWTTCSYCKGTGER